MKILFSELTVILSFILILFIQTFYSLFIISEDEKNILLRFIWFFFMVGLSYFSLKHKFYKKILAIILVVFGVSGIILFFLPGFEQWLLKSFFLILGIYYSIGGYKLLTRS